MINYSLTAQIVRVNITINELGDSAAYANQTKYTIDSLTWSKFLKYEQRCSMDFPVKLRDTLPDGCYEVYYNHTLAYRGFYCDSLKSGNWLYYHGNGSIYYVERFEKGIKLNSTSYSSIDNQWPKPLDKIIAPEIRFSLNHVGILPESVDSVRKIAAFMENHPSIKLEISSHTDTRGSELSSKLLSQKRAEVLKWVLVDRFKISPNRIITRGAGAYESLITKEDILHLTDKAEKERLHQVNRRTELKIL